MDSDPQNTPQPQFNAPEPVIPTEPSSFVPQEQEVPPTFSTESAPMRSPKKSNKNLIIISIIAAILLIGGGVAAAVLLSSKKATVVVNKENTVTDDPTQMTKTPKVVEAPKTLTKYVNTKKGDSTKILYFKRNDDTFAYNFELTVNNVVRNYVAPSNIINIISRKIVDGTEIIAVDLTLKKLEEEWAGGFGGKLELIADNIAYRSEIAFLAHGGHDKYFTSNNLVEGVDITSGLEVFTNVKKGATDLRLRYTNQEYNYEEFDEQTVIYEIEI